MEMGSRDFTIEGSYAYVAADLNGLVIIDISDPEHPDSVGNCRPEMDCRDTDVAVDGHFAYMAADWSGVRIIDIAEPAAPRVRGSCGTESVALGIAVKGGYAFVADGLAGLCVVDISNPDFPWVVNYVGTPGGWANGIVLNAEHALVTNYEGGLHVFDVSYPPVPHLVGFYDTPGYAAGIATAGTFAYVADASNLGISDCSEALSAPPSSDFILHPSSVILSAFPNPFNSSTTIRFTLPRPGPVSLEAYDHFGRRIREVIPTQRFQAGAQTITWDANALPSGCYLLNLQADGQGRIISSVKAK
jgi:hypothetical protein